MSRFENHARNVIAAVLSTLVPPHRTDVASVRRRLEESPAKVLVLRSNQGMGDLLLATPVLRALKQTYPTMDLHFLASAYNQIIVRHNPHVSKIYLLQKNVFRFFGLVGALRRERYDLAIVLFSNAPSFLTFLIARLSGARVVWSYGTARFYEGTNWSEQLADVAIPPPPEETPEYLKFQGMVKPLVPSFSPEPEFQLMPDDVAWGKEFWARFNSTNSLPTVGLFLGGGTGRPERLWKAGAWAELAGKLQATGRYRVIAIVPPPKLRAGGGHAESDMRQDFMAALGGTIPVFVEKGIPKAAAFLRYLDLHICPDGGLYHVSCAGGTPTLGLFIGTDSARWKPAVPWAHAIEAPDRTAASLTAENVFQAALAILESAPLRTSR